MLKKSLFLTAAIFTASSLLAVCSISKDEDDEGRQIIYMENSRIKVGLMPESNGRISELILKDDGEERHFFPEVEFKTLEVDDGISLVAKTNYAGLEDWAWESGAVKKNIPYTAKIVKNTPQEVTITLTAEFGAWAKVERTMSIVENSAVLQVSVKFTNTTDKPVKSSYWQHIMLNFDRNMDVGGSARLIIPLKNAGTPVFRNKLSVQQPGTDCLLDRPALSENPKAEEVSRVSQPWRAVKHEDLMFAMLIPLAQISDGVAYHYADDNSLSVENVFNYTEYAPGASHTFNTAIAVMTAMDKVDFIDKNVAVGCTVKNHSVTIQALRSGSGENFTIGVEAVKNGKVVEDVKTAAKLPASGEPFTAELKFKNNISDCQLFLVITGQNGKTAAKSALLKPVKW
ncbi:MAG: hypothetical protein E7058_02780 [Lentisphaerae bacterium]|nr:hypothetical protein [Lentisphaerota bacterium]